MKRSLGLGIALLVCGSPSITPAGAAGAVRCGDYVARHDEYRQLRASSTSCRRARSLVRAWAYKDVHRGGWIHFAKPAGWQCKLFTTDTGQVIRCDSAGRTAHVSFRPGHGP